MSDYAEFDDWSREELIDRIVDLEDEIEDLRGDLDELEGDEDVDD